MRLWCVDIPEPHPLGRGRVLGIEAYGETAEDAIADAVRAIGRKEPDAVGVWRSSARAELVGEMPDAT